MTWIFAATAAAAIGVAGYWIGRHHQEEEGDQPAGGPREAFGNELREAVGNALDRETRRSWPRLSFPDLPDSALDKGLVEKVRGQINGAAEIASQMEPPRLPSQGGSRPPQVFPSGSGHRFLSWLNSQGCVTGARLAVASAEGVTPYGMATSNPGMVPVSYNLLVRDAGGEIRLLPGVAYIRILRGADLLPAEKLE